jgi:hypothetical protein
MARRDVIVIGAAAGGVDAVVELARGLPSTLPAAVFVVVHSADDHESVLPELLSRVTPLPASHAVDGQPFEEGRIYVGGSGSHLVLDAGRVRLAAGLRENGHRPSVDVLFRSASRAYGPRVTPSWLVARALRSEALSSRLIAMLQPPATKREDASAAARRSLPEPAREPSPRAAGVSGEPC